MLYFFSSTLSSNQTYEKSVINNKLFFGSFEICRIVCWIGIAERNILWQCQIWHQIASVVRCQLYSAFFFCECDFFDSASSFLLSYGIARRTKLQYVQQRSTSSFLCTCQYFHLEKPFNRQRYKVKKKGGRATHFSETNRNITQQCW